MVDIKIRRNKASYSLSMEGHAGYSAYGQDIVCAALSGLVYALLGYLSNSDTVKNLSAKERPGMMQITCESADPRTGAAFEMAAIGFLQIEMGYKENVNVRVVGKLCPSSPAAAFGRQW